MIAILTTTKRFKSAFYIDNEPTINAFKIVFFRNLSSPVILFFFKGKYYIKSCNLLMYIHYIWQYGLSSFQGRDAKLANFLANNRHTQRKLFYFVNSEKSSKIEHYFRKYCVFKVEVSEKCSKQKLWS